MDYAGMPALSASQLFDLAMQDIWSILAKDALAQKRCRMQTPNSLL